MSRTYSALWQIACSALLATLLLAPSAFGQGFPGQKKEADLANLGVIGARGDVSGSLIRVSEVLPGGGAKRAGLAAGDEILGVGEKNFSSSTPLLELYAAIERVEAARKRQPLKLKVRRGGNETELLVPVARLGACSKSCPKKCKRCDKIVKAGLGFLAKTQVGNGCLPTDLGGRTGLIVVTSLGGLAFLSAGTSPKPGTPLGRAIEYVLKNANTPDKGGLKMGGRGNWNQENWAHAYALCFLAEVANKTRRKDVKAKVKELANKLLETMEASGGWAHGPGGPNALNYLELEIVSNYALLGLGAARRLGIELDEAKLGKAMAWIESTSGGDGGVGYSPRSGQKGHGDPGRTAGALVAFAALGQKKRPFYRKMVSFYANHVGELPAGHVKRCGIGPFGDDAAGSREAVRTSWAGRERAGVRSSGVKWVSGVRRRRARSSRRLDRRDGSVETLWADTPSTPRLSLPAQAARLGA
ncbi:MAG: PDZ domain-containing protein [Planctomycetes bacterium]|nr:PDZ domain-containing protein [Planctomycetota bacterium]